MSELTLDDVQRDAFAGHLDGVCVAQLMGREASAHAGLMGDASQLLAASPRRAGAPQSRSVDAAEQRADGELYAPAEPWLQLLPGPGVHADLAALSALPAPNEHRTTLLVEVQLAERERLTDSQARTPEHDDQRAQRSPLAPWPAWRMAATISSTVGGSAG